MVQTFYEFSKANGGELKINSLKYEGSELVQSLPVEV